MANSIAPVSFRWPRFRLAETDASDLVSAACYRLLEHVGVHAVIIADLKLRDVERHIFGAHLMERANHAPFEDAPKALNRVRVNRANKVLLVAVLHGFARIFFQAPIDLVLVRSQQAHLILPMKRAVSLLMMKFRFQTLAAARRAARTPSASARTRSATAATAATDGLPSGPRLLRTASTSAEPTTTPSACSAMARACSAVRTPKPTQTGSLVWRLMRVTAAATWPASGAAAP